MKEYVDRNTVLNIILRTSGDYAAAFSEVRRLEAAKVEPVFHGAWLIDKDVPYCSECGENAVLTTGNFYHCGKYCPHCGSKMER